MRIMLRRLVLLSIGILVAAGCAKQETVKKDEMVPPIASSKAAEATVVKPAEPEAGIKKQPIKDGQIVGQAKGDVDQKTKTEAQLQVALTKIFFDFDSSELSPAAREALVKNAELLKQNNGFQVRIEGNSDERGSDEYNLALGERRAQGALKYLITLGVPAARLSTISYGEEKPADPGHSEAAWAKNRRDDFTVILK
ncbi:peptidoglycan-associated lipoprotein Pal [Geobacter hydrogenophilus]|uniref:Peptidoglycan-associated lipoprotein n=1 Tax=Geobacter hydrogenophilus TaxID=40983 RepID=A0A9W6G1S2_9BACT|nr:peptidoglycan-associated lipoprotein Pal [Geobacter hydrogenophilus]MBT0895436.1 peptidoglycan-associated lipoprotein Pal [Geobacter hydrogenophilus]GLI38792.1 peptidoglycan-associated lipoprotein [Geobacter hydrogenophilus]